MKTFVVVRMLAKGGISVLRTESFGAVDIRSPELDTPAERSALHASCLTFGEEPDDTFSMRIVTVVEADNVYWADKLAGERFEEVANIRSAQVSSSAQIRLLEAGFIRTIGIGVVPREPRRRRNPGTFFRVTSGLFAPIDFGRWLCTTERTDLAKRLVRSYHWSHRAQLEPNRQLRILFRWFAMETIWALGKDDGDIGPRILWALGIPNGKGRALLSDERLSRLSNHASYAYWKNELERTIKEVRIFRNDTVHSGFRAQDKTFEELRQYSRITRIACKGVQRHAEMGLEANIETTAELLEFLPILLDTDDYFDHIIGTLIWGLDNPMPYDDDG